MGNIILYYILVSSNILRPLISGEFKGDFILIIFYISDTLESSLMKVNFEHLK
jgi:hypothetical protein